jgi:AraC-like DNA-binding protein
MNSESSVVGIKQLAYGAGSQGKKKEISFWLRPNEQVCIQHFHHTEDVSYLPHTYPEYCIVIGLKGSVTKCQLGERVVIGPGESLMSNSGVASDSSYLTHGQACEMICLSVRREVLLKLLVDFRSLQVIGQTSPVFLGKLTRRVLHACALDMVEEMQNRELGYEIVVEGLAMRILVETLRHWPRARIEMRKVDLTPKLPRREFVRAYDFMRRCPKDEFRLQTLCRYLGSSEERFTRLFRATTSESPARFYNRMLLERGRVLLRHRALSTKQISLELGFKTSSHFIAAFRRQFGKPPQIYRTHCDEPNAPDLGQTRHPQ